VASRPWAVRKDRVGAVRTRLAKMLGERGVEIDPEDLRTQKGYWRMGYVDVCRWDGEGTAKGLPGCLDGAAVHVYSWDRMRDLVREGFVTSSDHYGELELHRVGGKHADRG
jgi:hypothetical protein